MPDGVAPSSSTPIEARRDAELVGGTVVPARTFFGLRLKQQPTGWDVGAYALGLWCLGHEAGLLPSPAQVVASIIGF